VAKIGGTSVADHPTRSPDSPDPQTFHDPDTDPDPMRYEPTDDDLARIVAFSGHIGAHIVPNDSDREMAKRVHYALDRLEMRLTNAPPRSPDSVRTPDLDVERLREAMRRHAEREGMHACSHYVEGYNCPPEIAAEYAALHPASPPQEGEK
jgi:hypothetical protein